MLMLQMLVLVALAAITPSFSCVLQSINRRTATSSFYNNKDNDCCRSFKTRRRKAIPISGGISSRTGWSLFLEASTSGRVDITDRTTSTTTVKIGDLLSDLPTPSLLLEISLLERYMSSQNMTMSVDDFLLQDPSTCPHSSETLFNQQSNALYIHTSVTSTEKRDSFLIHNNNGSGKSLSICDIDAPFDSIKGGAYLGLGLANHHVGGYYWARSMGIGAALPAHGISFVGTNQEGGGELVWKKRGPGDVYETTEESSNSNDGKRSEWADFLTVGDTIQLVPYQPWNVLFSSQPTALFNTLIGVRRTGRPLGSDPIVEQIWKRQRHTDGQIGWINISKDKNNNN